MQSLREANGTNSSQSSVVINSQDENHSGHHVENMDVLEEHSQSTLTPRSVLVVGHSSVQSLGEPLKEILPQGAPLIIRNAEEPDILSIRTELDPALSEINGPVAVFLQAGYHECMEYESSKLLATID